MAWAARRGSAVDGWAQACGHVVASHGLTQGLPVVLPYHRLHLPGPSPGEEGGAVGRPVTHCYRVRCTWAGSTGVGYAAYDRVHGVAFPPALAPLELSADPAFRGDPDRANPEQLLLAAAASCQLLSFLAAAARARIDVVAYEDEAEAVMPEADPPLRITEVWLRPRITVRAPATEARVRGLVEVAHRECFIARSLRSDVRIDPVVEIVA